MKNYLLVYRGQIEALTTQQQQLLFVTTHPEKQATALYRLQFEHDKVAQFTYPLPCGAWQLCADDKQHVWLAGDDGKVYQFKDFKGKPKLIVDTDSDAKASALQHIDGKLLLVQGRQILWIDINSGKILQRLSLSDNSHVAALDPSQQWLAVGLHNGDIAVYQYHDATWQFSAQANIHQGQVTALQFEPHELRFYSAGADKKLFNTHAQGELQAIDKGRSSNHNSTIHSIAMGESRFFTAAYDKTIKAWGYAGGRPLSLNKGLGKINEIALLEQEQRKLLIAACTDSSFCMVPLVAGEELNEVRMRIRDLYAWCRDAFQGDDSKQQQQALERLAESDDKKGFEILSQALSNSTDRTLRTQIIKIATASQHPQAGQLLNQALHDTQHGEVRQAALQGLIKHHPDSLYPYLQALDSEHVDIGSQALQALAKVAAKQPQAEQALIQTLEHAQRSLRLQALHLLEKVYSKKSPQASLHALQVEHPELQRAALIRLYQRELLALPEVQRSVLLAQDSDDAWVRHTAFLIAILTQPNLAQVLREHAPDLARQLKEFDDFDLLGDETGKNAPSGLLHKAGKLLRAALQTEHPLSEADYTPLLQGMTSRHADTCFYAAQTLAILQDQRAFGLLLLLAQEHDAEIRAGVCRALAWLQHPQAIPQLSLLLDDATDTVRDSAFSALQVLVDDVWQVVDYGFASQHEDIHRRSLKTLLDKVAKYKKLPKQGLSRLQQALNNPFAGIRQETFKISLNRQLGGDLAATLRLLLHSQYENLHQEVLNEILAHQREDWAVELLPELFADNYQSIRQQALGSALKDKKRYPRQQVLEQAVTSPFADVRRTVLEQLRNKPNTADWVLLQRLLDDEDRELRVLALQNIVHAQEATSLQNALSSRYPEIRSHAAIACAQLGLAAAYPALQQQVAQPKPEAKEQQADWQQNVYYALQGLALLQDSRAFNDVLEQAQSQEKDLARFAAQVLPWVSAKQHHDELQGLLQDERQELRAHAALALAWQHDPQGQQVLQAGKTRKHIDTPLLLAASLQQETLQIAHLRPYLEDSSSEFSAMLALFSHELLQHSQQPELSLRALSLPLPALQVLCADLLSQYQDPAARWHYVQQWFSKQLESAEQKQWLVPIAELQQLAAILVHGTAHLQAACLQMLATLQRKPRIEHWQQLYKAFGKRFQQAIQHAEQQLATPEPDTQQREHWQQLAFGAYLGILRLDNRRAKGFDKRLQALRGMTQLAQADTPLQQSVNSCLLSLLNHPHSVLRQQAYEHLQALGMPLDQLGNAAIVSRHEDIAIKGLNVLVEHYPLKKSRKLLQDAVVTGAETLAQEAYRLLLEDPEFGLTALAPLALQSYTASIRSQCIHALGQSYQQPAAQQLLLEASQNSQREVALHATYVLAQQQHPQTLQCVERLWSQCEDTLQQNLLLRALKQWRGEGVAQFLLQASHEPRHLKLEAAVLYEALGTQRDRSVVEALLQDLHSQPKKQHAIANAILTISGFDQTIEDDLEQDEDSVEQSWLKEQYPRHVDTLLQLFRAVVKLDWGKMLSSLQESMQWIAANPDADAALSEAAAVADADLLQELLETIAFRARRRQGDVTTLLQQLSHKNPEIQFLAAEGLARSGHQQGNSVLLAASEYQDDIEQRERAIIALGESGDIAVLDRLLELAETQEHALQEAATEAIGHLGNSEHAERIFKRLQHALEHSDYYSDMHERALRGLRWFNTLEAWQAIAAYSQDETKADYNRVFALQLLRHWDSDYSRELLLQTLRDSNSYQRTEAAWESATHFWPITPEQCSPVDITTLYAYYSPSYFGDGKALERVCAYASAEQLLELLTQRSRDSYNINSQLQQALLQRDQQDSSSLVNGLLAEKSVTVALIARLVLRQLQPQAELQAALQQALNQHMQQWQELREQHLQNPSDSSLESRWQQSQQTVALLLQAATTQQLNTPQAIQCMQSQQRHYRDFQHGILQTLLRLDSTTDQALLQAVASQQQAELTHIRQLAQQVLQQHSQAADDWESFVHRPQRLADKQTAIQAAARSERHARALPILIRQHDISTLTAIARDEQLDERQRMAAIEGLGRIQTEAAEQELQSLFQQDGIDEDLGKAAFRALRRSQRARNKQQALNGAAA